MRLHPSKFSSLLLILLYALLTLGAATDRIQADPQTIPQAPADLKILSSSSCTDGVRNNTETDTDCGGSCPPCGLDRSCKTDADCQSGRCNNSICEQNDHPFFGESQGNGDIVGNFYGNPYSGDGTGNTRQFRHSASRRFRALRTGKVTAVTYQNRVLLQADIDSRAKGDNVWARCKNAGLDNYTCGYSLSNSYSLGNGGRLRIELHPDDGTSDHFPADTVLAATEAFVPMELQHLKFPKFELNHPAHLQAGEIYHLVFVQLNPPECGRGLSVSQAKACDRDKGLVGLNGVHFTIGRLPDTPFGSKTEAVLLRDSSSDPWYWDKGELAWYAVRYAEDGKWFGHMMTYYDGNRDGDEGGGNRFVGGSKRARQVFTVQDKGYEVNGLWVRVDRTPNTTGVLNLAVKQDDQVLASGAIPAGRTVSNCDDHCSGDWVYTPLSSPVTLVEGQTYAVEFSADAGQAFSLQSGFPMDYGQFKITDQDNSGSWWSEAQAEYSADSGGSWGDYSIKKGRGYHPKRDLSIVFTLAAGPHRLP